MDCKRAEELIMEYLDGVISDNDRIELMKHTDKCFKCKEELSLMLETVGMIENLEEINPPEDIENIVMESIDVQKYRKSNKIIFTCVFISIFSLTGIMGITFTKLFIKYISIKELLISIIVDFTNFLAFTLPKLLYFVSKGLTYISSILAQYFGVLILLLLLLALVEVYFVKIIKYSKEEWL